MYVCMYVCMYVRHTYNYLYVNQLASNTYRYNAHTIYTTTCMSLSSGLLTNLGSILQITQWLCSRWALCSFNSGAVQSWCSLGQFYLFTELWTGQQGQSTIVKLTQEFRPPLGFMYLGVQIHKLFSEKFSDHVLVCKNGVLKNQKHILSKKINVHGLT